MRPCWICKSVYAKGNAKYGIVCNTCEKQLEKGASIQDVVAMRWKG